MIDGDLCLRSWMVEFGFWLSFDFELGMKNFVICVRVLNVCLYWVVGFGFECEEDVMDVCIDMVLICWFD